MPSTRAGCPMGTAQPTARLRSITNNELLSLFELHLGAVVAASRRPTSPSCPRTRWHSVGARPAPTAETRRIRRARVAGGYLPLRQLPRTRRISLTRLTTAQGPAHERCPCRAAGRCRWRTRNRQRSPVPLCSPRVQLFDQIEAQIDFADTRGRLGLLDHEALARGIDGPPPERARLADP